MLFYSNILMKEYSLQSIREMKESILRPYFDMIEGELILRDIDIQKTTRQITDIEKRPEYVPQLLITQLKKTKEGARLLFYEDIYTSDKFLDGFEEFLRANCFSIGAEGFENKPKQYEQYFQTPFTLIPCDIERRTISINRQKIDFYTFRGVDFKQICKLNVIEPEIVQRKLAEIEKAGKYSIFIKEISAEDFEKKNITNEYQKLRGFEQRRGNEYNTIDHIVFKEL